MYITPLNFKNVLLIVVCLLGGGTVCRGRVEASKNGVRDQPACVVEVNVSAERGGVLVVLG
jgi:hypothetical protein